MNIQISDHFDYKRLIRFVLPSVGMMICLSIYSVVDGFFVSNFVGKIPFAAVNFIFPILMLLGAVGIVFGTGGNALVSKIMGEGDDKRANRVFSMLIYVAFGIGIVLMAGGILLIPAIAEKLGAEGEMLKGCIVYGRIILLALPAYVLQNAFQSFFVTAEKPHLGFAVTVAAGVSNIVLDWLCIVILKWGLVGAAIATASSQVVGGIVPCIYFARKNSSRLHLGKTHFDSKALMRTCTNGVSEFVTNIAMSVVSVLYNIQLLKYAGEDGVAAYGVLMYVTFIFVAVFLGYSIGTAPLFGYNYGARNSAELKNLLGRSLKIISVLGVAIFMVCELGAELFAYIFVGYDQQLMNMTAQAFKIYAIAFLFMGFAIFGSGFFTALNNGLVSAVISFMRTLVFEVGAVMILPVFFGLTGIWSSVVVAEVIALVLTTAFMLALRKKYGY